MVSYTIYLEGNLIQLNPMNISHNPTNTNSLNNITPITLPLNKTLTNNFSLLQSKHSKKSNLNNSLNNITNNFPNQSNSSMINIAKPGNISL